jgi:hypothetical protein
MLQIGINAITYAAGYLSKPSRNINVVLAKKVLSIPIMTAVLSSSATLKAINKKTFGGFTVPNDKFITYVAQIESKLFKFSRSDAL